MVSGKGELADKGEIIAPIARSDDSIITRCVHPSGKYAHTSYEVVARFGEVALVDIRLHTGRTHQIRVHFRILVFHCWEMICMVEVWIMALHVKLCIAITFAL